MTSGDSVRRQPGARTLGQAPTSGGVAELGGQGLHMWALTHHAPCILDTHSGHRTHTGHSTPVRTGIHVTLHRVHTSHSTTDRHTDVAELGPGEPRSTSGSPCSSAGRSTSCSPPFPAPEPYPSAASKARRNPIPVSQAGLGTRDRNWTFYR